MTRRIVIAPVQPQTLCVTLDKSFHLSEPQFPHLSQKKGGFNAHRRSPLLLSSAIILSDSLLHSPTSFFGWVGAKLLSGFNSLKHFTLC